MFDLRALRRDHKLSQNALAAILDCGQPFVSQVENGNDPMPQEWKDKLAAKLDISDISRYETDSDKPSQNIIGDYNSGSNVFTMNSEDLLRQFLNAVNDVKKTYEEQLRHANEHISELTAIIVNLSKK